MTVPSSFYLPPEATGFEIRRSGESPVPGCFSPPPLLWADFDRDGAETLVAGLRAAAGSLSARRVSDLAATLGEIAERFLDPTDPLRQEAEARVSAESGLSRPVAVETVARMAEDWTAERLEAMVQADFPDPGVLDGFRHGTRGDFVRARGGPFSLHVASGNVPGVGATSLIRSLLVKSPVLLKPGRADIALPVLFARALAKRDPEAGRAVAVVYWPRGEGGELEEVALASANRIVAYGGNEFLQGLRDRVPVTTPFVAYPHRVSVGAVGRDLLRTAAGAEAVAGEAAEAVAAFDCRGCVSPKVIWVEEGEEATPEKWAGLLAERLDALEERLPSGPLDAAAAASLHHRRGIAELRHAGGRGNEIFSGRSSSWAVFYEPGTELSAELPEPGRSILVKPIARLEDLPGVLGGLSEVLQSLALATSEPRRRELADRMASAGITRVTTFARLPWPPAWWRHDGVGPLATLVRWTSLEPKD